MAGGVLDLRYNFVPVAVQRARHGWWSEPGSDPQAPLTAPHTSGTVTCSEGSEQAISDSENEASEYSLIADSRYASVDADDKLITAVQRKPWGNDRTDVHVPRVFHSLRDVLLGLSETWTYIRNLSSSSCSVSDAVRISDSLDDTAAIQDVTTLV
jgi:hypothetical protein